MPALLFSAPSRAPRQSNLELLRIVAMLLVLVLHADYHTLGAYEPAEFHSQPVPTATRLLVEQGALVCVNVFVLLSGWFGIRARARGVASLLFQYYFFGLLLFLALLGVDGHADGDVWGVLLSVLNMNRFWFVPAYLLLYLLAPALNAFVAQSSRRRLGRFLAVYYALLFVGGWMLDGAAGLFHDGYSPLAFVGLYLLARYVHLYVPAWRRLRARHAFLAATLLVVLPATAELWLLRLAPGDVYFWWRQHNLSYLAPHVVACALFLLLGFARLRFTSPAVNRVAMSAFAVYLLHLHPYVEPCFQQVVRQVYQSFSGPLCLLLLALFLLGVFAAAVALDQLRLRCWRPLSRRLFPPAGTGVGRSERKA